MASLNRHGGEYTEPVPDAIILFSHGSVLCGAGENLRRIAALMEARGGAAIVETGFLNYSEPLLAEAFARCVQRGARRITVVPYFLVAGKFVSVDLPRAVAKAVEPYPEVEVLLSEAMKAHPALAEAVLNCAARPAPPAFWRRSWAIAPELCRASSQCPLFGGPDCPATNGAQTWAAAVQAPLKPSAASLAASRALLAMVHGSPRLESNADMYAVIEMVRARGVFDIVEVGFMECNEPSIPTAIAACVAAGAASIVGVPYFLHTGNHVTADLPALLEEAVLKYPDVEIAMADFIGHDDAIAEVLKARADEALPFSLAQPSE